MRGGIFKGLRIKELFNHKIPSFFDALKDMKSVSFARKITIIEGRVEASCHSRLATRLNCHQVKLKNGIEISVMSRAFFESSPLRGISLAELMEEASSQSVIDFRTCGTAPLTALGKSRAPGGSGGSQPFSRPFS